MFETYQLYELVEGESDDDSSQLEDENPIIRISTAPARPLTEFEEFKRSIEFRLLEESVLRSSHLIQKCDQKYDLDSIEGQKQCKKFLNLLERLNEIYKTTPSSRGYRNDFSKAYKVLYKQDSLCYLTEILDSAQEKFPYLYVNGEKFDFTEEVLQTGTKMVQSFAKTQHYLRNIYNKIISESINLSIPSIKKDIIMILNEFDYNWVNFERMYIKELMKIELEARRHIIKAISINKELRTIEITQRVKGRISLNNDHYHKLRQKLVLTISHINSVANIEGIGRDDLHVDILLEAEGIIRRVSTEQSRAVRKIAEEIKNSFLKIRNILHKYEENIEIVDPQLRNNSDLVDALNEYEKTWEKGKAYFLDGKKCKNLIFFSHILEATSEKYKEFHEQLECRDSFIFMAIPCLIILKNLDNDDKNICNYFLPQMFDQKNSINVLYIAVKQQFSLWKSLKTKNYDYFNIVERKILGLEKDENMKTEIVDSIIHKIKVLAMELERNNPVEWNNFLEAALDYSY